MRAREHLTRASELRRRIREADDSVSEGELRRLCDDARDETDNVRLLGDLALSAFFEESKPKQREDLRRQLADAVQRGEMHRYRSWIEELRRNEPPLAPFHWAIEFPEVFECEPACGEEERNPGFDAIVGNPPFLGGKRISTVLGIDYSNWLASLHDGSNSNADLVAHFFRRAFGLLRTGGTSGLIATNTIAQGDTRSTGLRWICTHGGEIYEARRRVKWPGLAAVVVSVLHIAKGSPAGGPARGPVGHEIAESGRSAGEEDVSPESPPVAEWIDARMLDDRPVERITAFLFHRSGHTDPVRLAANAGKSFQGSIVLSMGFTFDDADRKGVATPLAEMRRLVETDPHNRDAIFPYIGGEEVNTSPTHAHHRYVINFRDYSLRRAELDERWADADERRRGEWLRKGVAPMDYPGPVAADWPELLGIVEEKVKPERDAQNHKALRERWWHYADK